MRSDNAFGQENLAQFITKVFSRDGVRVLCKLLKFLHTKPVKLCLYGAGFVHRGTVMLEQKKKNSCPELLAQRMEVQNCLKCLCICSSNSTLLWKQWNSFILRGVHIPLVSLHFYGKAGYPIFLTGPYRKIVFGISLYTNIHHTVHPIKTGFKK